MEDPVFCSDGHSYERAKIEKWLRKNQTSPVTRERLESISLTTNWNLKSRIDTWRQSATDMIPDGVPSSMLARSPSLNDPGSWDYMISYTQHNAKAELLAAELYASLRERGKTVWLDVKMGKLNTAAMQEAAQVLPLTLTILCGRLSRQDR